MEQTQGLERIKQARARLFLSQPFYGALALGLKLELSHAVKVAATDGKKLLINPAATDKMPLPQVEGLLCHEVLHCAMGHPWRLGDRDHSTANKAGDFVINGTIKRSGMSLPEGGLYDPKYSAPEMSMESVYALLRKKEQEQEKQKQKNMPKNDPGDDNGSGEGEDEGEEEKNEPGESQDGENGNLKPGGKGETGPKGKSGAPGEGDPDENDPGEGGAPGPEDFGTFQAPRTDDGRPLGEAEKKVLEQDWIIRMTQALQASQAAGKVPAGMERLVELAQVRQRDIEDALRAFVISTRGGDYSYRRPRRAHLIHDIYSPSVDQKTLPLIVMVMDTSGSIGQDQVNYFAAKINNVIGEFGCNIRIIWCDSEAHDGGEYGPADLPLQLTPKGGGGTDFRPPFDLIEKEGWDPAAVVYFTDGECGSFPKEPDYPVFWALWGRGRQWPWGDGISIDPTVAL